MSYQTLECCLFKVKYHDEAPYFLSRRKSKHSKCATTSILKETKIRSHKLILLGRNKLPIKKYNHLLKAYNKFGRTCKHLLTTPIKDNQLTCNERGGVIKIKTACKKEPR